MSIFRSWRARKILKTHTSTRHGKPFLEVSPDRFRTALFLVDARALTTTDLKACAAEIRKHCEEVCVIAVADKAGDVDVAVEWVLKKELSHTLRLKSDRQIKGLTVKSDVALCYNPKGVQEVQYLLATHRSDLKAGCASDWLLLYDLTVGLEPTAGPLDFIHQTFQLLRNISRYEKS